MSIKTEHKTPSALVCLTDFCEQRDRLVPMLRAQG